MARFHRQKFEDIVNTGFGPNSSVEGSRLINKEGEADLRKVGLPLWERISIYHTLLRMKTSTFLIVVLLFYTTINIIFAFIYFFIGVENLLGADGNMPPFNKYMQAFFFSAQTLTTVGYGHVAPMGMITNIAAAIESLVGILAFALVTVLIYGRFARPRAYILFSKNSIIAPYKHGKGIMFRIATYKNNHLTDVEANLTVALHEYENGKEITKFYQLPLEISKINSLALSWTIVHYLNDKSPLYGYTNKDFVDNKVEFISNIKAFDDHFSNIVQQRTSYTHNEIVYGAKFLPMFRRAEKGTHTILELNKVNAYEMVTLPEEIQDEFSESGTMTAKS